MDGSSSQSPSSSTSPSNSPSVSPSSSYSPSASVSPSLPPELDVVFIVNTGKFAKHIYGRNYKEL